MITVRSPYLIQRARINNPLAEATERLNNTVRWDYMGAAEFEFGALPESLRRMQAQKEKFSSRVVHEIRDEDSPLRIFSYLDDENFKIYLEYINKLRNPPANPRERVHLKERTEFSLEEKRFDEQYYANRKGKNAYIPQRANFWWDITNDVMFSFHKMYMNRLGHHLTASFEYMDNLKKSGN